VVTQPPDPTTSAAADADILRLQGISKHFGGLRALDDVTFSVRRGEVHAIVGENGAGKSTLMKILAGVERADAGRVLLGGKVVEISSPDAARRHGVAIVFQELSLFPDLTVAANICMGRERRGRLGLLDEPAMAEASRGVLASMGAGVSPGARVASLSVGQRQMVEIARALAAEARVVILDEPNSALNAAESGRLFELLGRLREQGTTILYVSHRLDEVFALADRITVLRDGKHQGTWKTAATDVSQVVKAMIGRTLEESFPERRQNATPGEPLMEVQTLARGARFGPVTFSLRAGEVLGVAGLEGSGVDTLFQLLFGLERPSSGEVRFRGSPRSLSPPRATEIGIGLIPRSRREDGLVMAWPIRKNATLNILDDLRSRFGLLDRGRERAAAAELVQRFGVTTDSIEKSVALLSGGNQQKVVLAKWLAAKPRVLLLHDPTRGVDVGAKAEVYRLIAELAGQGMGLLLTSSEIEETLGMSDRILVFSKGRIVREYARGAASREDVIHAMAAS